MTSNNFHSKCDNKNPTIIIYKNTKDSIFGGYTSLSWSNNGNYRSDPQAFIFTLNEIPSIIGSPTVLPINSVMAALL